MKLLLLLLLLGGGIACRNSRIAPESFLVLGKYVGSTPCDSLPREFLNVPSSQGCERIDWRLTFYGAGEGADRGTYALAVIYGIAETNGPGFFNGGNQMEISGVWNRAAGRRHAPDDTVMEVIELHAPAARARDRLALARVDNNLLHLLNDAGGLLAGNAGWSYTLNRQTSEP